MFTHWWIWLPKRIQPFWFVAKVELVKNWLPMRSTSGVNAKGGVLLRWTVLHCRIVWLRVSCLGMRREHLQERTASEKDALSWLMEALFSWMKLATFPCQPRWKFCGLFSNGNSNALAALKPSRLMFELLPRPTENWKKWLNVVNFAKICFTGSMSFPFLSLPYANAETTFRCLWIIL